MPNPTLPPAFLELLYAPVHSMVALPDTEEMRLYRRQGT